MELRAVQGKDLGFLLAYQEKMGWSGGNLGLQVLKSPPRSCGGVWGFGVAWLRVWRTDCLGSCRCISSLQRLRIKGEARHLRSYERGAKRGVTILDQYCIGVRIGFNVNAIAGTLGRRNRAQNQPRLTRVCVCVFFFFLLWGFRV